MSDMEKAPDAYRTISEVSEALDVPQHVLRFWETKFPQVAPMKRAGNRRYYNPDHISLLAQIRDLLYVEGYTTKGVQKLLEEGRLTAEGVQGGDPALAPRQTASSNLLDLTARQDAPVAPGAPPAIEPQSTASVQEVSREASPMPPAVPAVDRQSLEAIEARLSAAKARLASVLGL